MAEPIEIEDDKPLDPKVENIRRRMVRLLVLSIGSLLIGLLAVFGSIIYKINQSDDKPASGANPPAIIDTSKTITAKINLPKGARLIASNLDGNHILLTLQLADGKRQLQIYDLQSTRIFAILDLGN